jgi:hypothetical protein
MSALKAYPGSCHCGAVQYLAKLKFPANTSTTSSPDKIHIYKCNCSTCQKMGYFHLRPINPTEHYILLSPKPSELGDYRCFEKKHGWLFCKQCGVRVLGLGGEWEETEVDVREWAGESTSSLGPGVKEGLQTVWKTKAKEEGKRYYLSINAVTLEPSEEIDLREWHEKGWIFYVECRRNDGTSLRFGEPHEGGMY